MLGADIPFRSNLLLQISVAVFTLYWIFMGIWPVQRSLWLVENVLVIVLAIILVWTYRKFRFSNQSYLFILLFLILHTFATHYSYATTPIDEWLKTTFHTKRSYYDRFVHFAFGLLWVYPFGELYARLAGRCGAWPYIIPTAIVMALSALFEITEAACALIAGQGQNEGEYVGMQGDVFDTQKDMLAAFAGALLALALLLCRQWRKR
jgi:putative membrane protein